MIKKVLFINPSNTISANSIRRLSTPLGLLYMAGVLDKDYEVKVIDSVCEGYYNHYFNEDKTYLTYGLSDQDLKKQIAEFRPDIVGVGCMFSSREKNALNTCRLVKEVSPNIPVVLGGLHPSFFHQKMLSSGVVDYVILGEGEFRMKNLIECLNVGRNPDFDGIAFLKDGKPVVIPAVSKIQDLDSLPFPARHLVDMEKYIKIGVPFAPFARRDRVEGILTSRGCPFNCNFCASVNYWGRQFRMRSVGNIIREVEELISKYGIQEIQFADDNMTVNKAHAKEFFQELKKLNISWCAANGLNISTLDEELIKLMAESGAYQITFAVESGSERVLKEIIHKHIPPMERVKRLIDVAHENGVQVHATFVVGSPGEKREEIMATLDYPFKVGLDSASLFVVNPIPGSQLYDFCKEKNYLPLDLDFERMDFKSTNIIIPKDSPDYMIDPQELIELVDEKTKEFNDFSRAKNPKGWDDKFRNFLKRHPDDGDLILGRVT